MAEQAAHNRLVEGSNPSGPTLCLIGLARSRPGRRRENGRPKGHIPRAVRRPARSRLCLFNRTMHEGDLRSVGAHGLETGAIRAALSRNHYSGTFILNQD